MKSKKKLNVKDLQQRTDGNEMDLSMNQIDEIPVKDIGMIKKVDTIDLSINLIVVIPDEFCLVLQHLVKLDLSKNKIKELPENFGLLQQLQHLDLYHNQLRLIPLGFSQLKKLKWLDVKDNPLDPSYKKHVGDCLDDKQCRQCAKNVVAAMKQILAKREQQRLKKIEQQKKAQLLQQEKELAEMKKKEKNQERKRRKKEREQKAKLARNGTKVASIPQEMNEDADEVDHREEPIRRTRGGFGSFIFTILVVLAAIGIGSYFYCADNRSLKYCRVFYNFIESLSPTFYTFQEKATVLARHVSGYASDWLVVLKIEFSKLLDYLYVYYERTTNS